MILFWGHTTKDGKITKACFSQWYPSVFTVNGVSYTCAEQYMMASKARHFKDLITLQKILNASSPKEIKALGREVTPFNAEEWDKVCKDYVLLGNLAKFSQNSELKEFLLSTGDEIIAEASPYDKIWGIGLSADDPRALNPETWLGKNYLGEVLMEVRNTLK